MNDSQKMLNRHIFFFSNQDTFVHKFFEMFITIMRIIRVNYSITIMVRVFSTRLYLYSRIFIGRGNLSMGYSEKMTRKFNKKTRDIR